MPRYPRTFGLILWLTVRCTVSTVVLASLVEREAQLCMPSLAQPIIQCMYVRQLPHSLMGKGRGLAYQGVHPVACSTSQNGKTQDPYGGTSVSKVANVGSTTLDRSKLPLGRLKCTMSNHISQERESTATGLARAGRNVGTGPWPGNIGGEMRKRSPPHPQGAAVRDPDIPTQQGTDGA
jgi:hypothetical protein